MAKMLFWDVNTAIFTMLLTILFHLHLHVNNMLFRDVNLALVFSSENRTGLSVRTLG